MVFNASPWWQTVPIEAAGGLMLHPVQLAGLDPIVRLTSVDARTATVPPRTVAVLHSCPPEGSTRSVQRDRDL